MVSARPFVKRKVRDRSPYVTPCSCFWRIPDSVLLRLRSSSTLGGSTTEKHRSMPCDADGRRADCRSVVNGFDSRTRRYISGASTGCNGPSKSPEDGFDSLRFCHFDFMGPHGGWQMGVRLCSRPCVGSIPRAPLRFRYGPLAHLGERFHGMEEVDGS